MSANTPCFMRGTSCPISGSLIVSIMRAAMRSGAAIGVAFAICHASRNAPEGLARSCRLLKNAPLSDAR